MNRRRVLHRVALVGSLTLAGCGSDDGDDVSFPRLRRVIVTNGHSSQHAVTVTLYRAVDENRPDPDEPLVRRQFSLSPDESGYLTDFDRSASRYVLYWAVDGGERRSYRTGQVSGCTELSLDLSSDSGAADISRTEDICYPE